MKRNDVLIPPEELRRQQEIRQEIYTRISQLPQQPLAMVDTYGCQQN